MQALIAIRLVNSISAIINVSKLVQHVTGAIMSHRAFNLESLNIRDWFGHL